MGKGNGNRGKTGFRAPKYFSGGKPVARVGAPWLRKIGVKATTVSGGQKRRGSRPSVLKRTRSE